MLERGYDEWRAYRQSKLAQIMFSFECARRFPDVESVALHPATFMDTKMVRSRVGTPSQHGPGGRRRDRPARRRARPRRPGPLLRRPRGGPRRRAGLRPGRPQAALGRLRAARRLTRTIVITGGPGTGKSSVAQAFTTLLENAGIEHGAIESEQLAWGSPWLPDASRPRAARGGGRRPARLRAAAVRRRGHDRDPGRPRRPCSPRSARSGRSWRACARRATWRRRECSRASLSAGPAATALAAHARELAERHPAAPWSRPRARSHPERPRDADGR